MKIKIITLITIICLPIILNAQPWKRYRYEVCGGIGTSNFMGDLGGGSKEPSHFLGLRDLDLATTRPSIQIGIRYWIFSILAVKPTIGWGIVKGDDSQSGELNRFKRNLSFKSNIFEFNTQLEFYVLKAKPKRYVSQSPSLLNKINIYLLAGVGGFHFNPKAELDGKSYNLQKLGTEGQNDPESGVKPYKLWALNFPVGVGLTLELTSKIQIGIEISNRFSTTDYMDDASGSYYNINKIEEFAPLGFEGIATSLTDRHIEVDLKEAAKNGVDIYMKDFKTYESNHFKELPYIKASPHPENTPGRGNTNYNDAYVLFLFNFIYKIKTSRTGLPKFKS